MAGDERQLAREGAVCEQELKRLETKEYDAWVISPNNWLSRLD